VTHCFNPLSMDHDLLALPDPGERLSPNEIIASNALAFSRPVICIVNGDIWGRADWDHPVPEKGLVRFVELPRGGNLGKILGTIAVVALSIYTSGAVAAAYGAAWGAAAGLAVNIVGGLLISLLFPAVTAGTSDARTTYSLEGTNQLRVGEPFAERFGRTPFYPDLAQVAYVKRGEKVGNYDYPQRLYSLMILGQGEFDVEGIFIDETPLTDYDDVAYNIIEPGEYPTIVTNVVYVPSEVNNQELDNDDWCTFIVNPRGTTITAIEYEVAFPSGLIGHISSITQCRTVDDNGTATSGWVALHTFHFGEHATTFSWGRNFTVAVPLGAGRYEFRIRRQDGETTDLDNVEKGYLGALRGIGGAHPPAVNCTMLEVKIKASKQLNGEVANRINVIATRKLYPVTAAGFGATKVATRSIIDAVAYMVTSSNGGRQASSILVWDELYSLRGLFETEGYHFDWGFSSRLSVMDACATAARCGMALPYTPGGLFCLAADRLRSGVSDVFSGSSGIDEGTLKISHAFKTPASYDFVRVKYIDAATWTEDTVDCGSGDNPYEITLEGCMDRTHAWKVGIRMRNELALTTTSVEWTTGLQGYLPTLFSWVAVGEDSVDWGQTGVIVAVEPGGVLWTSEPLDFAGEESGWLMLQLPAGTAAGPYVVTPTNIAHKVMASIPDALATLQNDSVAATPYFFGPASEEVHVVRVTSIAPEGHDKVVISGDLANASAYDLSGTVPTPGSGVGVAPLTTISLYASEIGTSSQTLVAGWSGSAEMFLVEYKVGTGSYVTLLDGTTDHSATFAAALQDVTLRVTPYEDGVLDTSYQQVLTLEYTAATSLAVPANLALQSLLASAALFTWGAVSGASGYKLYVGASVDFSPETDGTLVYSGSVPYATVPLNLTVPYGYYFKVAATDATHQVASSLTFSPALPVVAAATTLAAPTGLTLQSTLASALIISWGTVVGASGYKVYVGTTSGFNPISAGTLVYSGSAPYATIPLNLTVPYTYYFKVAATDANHQAVGDLVFSTSLMVGKAAALAPAAPTGLQVTLNFGLTGSAYIAFWEEVSGATGYKLYKGATANFNPATAGTLIYSGTSSMRFFDLASVADPVYVKVAATNAEYQDASALNFSAAVQVPGTGA